MAEYIDREATVGLLENKYQDMSAMPASYYAGFQYALNMLKQIPSAADVAPVVRGQRPTIAHLHHRNPWRVLVLPQSGREPTPAPAEKLPGVVGADVEMGFRQPGHVSR